MRFVSVQLVEALHAQAIALFGGAPGLRDRGLLESAVNRQENLAYYNPDASIGEVAATLAWGLIKNHAFFDGNKRVGFAALSTFLDANGYQLVCSQQEETAMVLQVAAGEIGEDAWAEWVSRTIAPLCP